ncbi:S-adenosyl-L-methionine-dependent methyltransferase [Fomitopsis serialis]|uniref:S-adenosyl-L-methionine-dependent methyltransferase n=1 Tax=Fomitopsis serialis TaxID=139415 RepID=UPI002008C6EE|nr:S-adenosyl-L-methionine-dependent methyltransferase [Neoantrodia serialis]KAH9930312.1 S-adenosyl-L-methionine-dependent methyltransferase [Neoantrodia serialis]
MLASSSTRLAQVCRRSTLPALPRATRTLKHKATDKTADEKINYSKISFQDVPDAEHATYKRADIFTATEPVQFGKLRNILEFEEGVAQKYAEYGPDGEGPGRQIWHTPTELFKPWYGQAIAQCLVSEYLLKYFPYEDFIIYEIGAGNGTLALDILDYIQHRYPEVYDRTQYKIIEISENLAHLQREKLSTKHPCVDVTNQSIFRWSKREPAPCFFLAMEVIVSALPIRCRSRQ